MEKGWDGVGIRRDGFIKCFDIYEIYFTEPWIIQSSMSIYLSAPIIYARLSNPSRKSPSTTKVQLGLGANQI